MTEEIEKKIKEMKLAESIEDKCNIGVQIQILRAELKGKQQALKEVSEEINKEIKRLKEIVWCNAHDKAWIENTIKNLEKIKEKF